MPKAIIYAHSALFDLGQLLLRSEQEAGKANSFVTDCYRCSFSLTSLTSLEVFPLAFQKKGRQRGAAPTFPVGNISEAQPEGTQHRHASAHKGLQDKNWGGSLPVEHL